MADEDPTFKTRYDPDTGQTILSGMGELHLDIIVDRLVRAYRVNAKIGKPQVSYRETITESVRVEGSFIRQTGGHGQYGHVWLELEPMEQGGGFEFVNRIPGGVIPRQYIPAVEQGVKEAMESGVLAGYPVIDVRVIAFDGSYHQVDSSDVAFKMAGAIGFREGVRRAKPVLLEPIMKLEVATPKEFLGDIIGDLNSRRGIILSAENRDNYTVVQAEVPLSSMFGYATVIRGMTKGMGTFSMEMLRYAKVPVKISEEILARRREQTGQLAVK